MTKHSENHNQVPSTSEGKKYVDWEKFLGWPMFFILLVIIGVRPLIQETHDTARQPFAQVLSELPDVGPLPTLWINLTIMAIFGLTMALRSQGYLPRPRKSGLALGFVIVAIAAIASCFVASNQRLAINATFDWLTLPLLAISLAYLLQHTWQIRLALCVIIATGAASAVESFDDYYVTQPATAEMYEQNKDELWSQKGVPPDSYQIELYERRVYDHAAKGFFFLSNIAGNYFILPVFAVLGLAWTMRSHKPSLILALILYLTMVSALVLTKSRGAVAALAIGLLLGGCLLLFRNVIQKHKRKAFVLGWLTVIVVLAGIATYGLKHGRLPGSSLTFRWWYLETTARMVADHPFLGVGSEQYNRYYPRFKEIKSPEEISHPHNFFAQAAAEWGIPGLIGMILMLVGGSRVAGGIPPKTTMECGARNEEDKLKSSAWLIWGLGLLVAIWSLRILIVGLADPTYIYATNAYPILGWAIAFAICSGPIPDAHRMKSLGLWTALGLFAFLVHNLITFGLFIPECATTFFALLAICLAFRNDESAVITEPTASAREPTEPRASARGNLSSLPRLRRPFLLSPFVFATLVCMTLTYVWAIRPVSRCWRYLQYAREVSNDKTHYVLNYDLLPTPNPNELYQPASSIDQLDPTADRERAELWLKLGSTRNFQIKILRDNNVEWGYLTALSALNAVQRDPKNISNHRLLAATYLKNYTTLESLWEAVRTYETVLESYPTNPDDHIRMSQIQTMIYETTLDQKALDRAIKELELAVELDNQRDKNEVRRFSEGKVDYLEEELARLRELKTEKP